MDCCLCHLEDRGEEVPGSFQLIISDEESLVPIDDIQYETLISIWEGLVVARLVRQIQLLHI